MRKYLFVTAAILLATGHAQAISRHNINHLTCYQVQDIIDDEGAAILRYTATSGSGMTLYDRYVADGSYCEAPKVAKSTTVPTADDDYCPVTFCKEPAYKHN